MTILLLVYALGVGVVALAFELHNVLSPAQWRFAPRNLAFMAIAWPLMVLLVLILMLFGSSKDVAWMARGGQ